MKQPLKKSGKRTNKQDEYCLSSWKRGDVCIMNLSMLEVSLFSGATGLQMATSDINGKSFMGIIVVT